MNARLRMLFVLALVLATLSACATPTPEVVKEKETVVVRETVEKIVTATPPPPPEPVKLEVWFLSQSPEEIKLIEGLSAKFGEKHPGVSVTVSAYGYDEMNKTLKLALDGGIGPDVAYCSPGGITHLAYAKAGHLIELTDIVKERGWDQRHPMDAIMYPQKELGGPIWGVPFDLTNVGVFYNKEIFGKLGLKPATTWAEFEALLSAIKTAGYTPFSVGALDGWPLDHYFIILGHVTTPIAKIEALNYVQPGVSLTEDSFVQAATILKGWVDKGYFNDGFLATSYDDANNLFITGKTAMHIGGTWNNATFVQQADFEPGFFAVPRVNPDLEWHSLVTPNNVWVLPKYSKHQELALDYVDYMLGGEVAKALWDSGDIPTFSFATLPPATSGLQADVYRAGLATGIGYYWANNMPEFAEAEVSALQKMVGGELSPQQALTMMEESHAKEVARAQQ